MSGAPPGTDERLEVLLESFTKTALQKRSEGDQQLKTVITKCSPFNSASNGIFVRILFCFQ
jgi:hypothetical protein